MCVCVCEELLFHISILRLYRNNKKREKENLEKKKAKMSANAQNSLAMMRGAVEQYKFELNKTRILVHLNFFKLITQTVKSLMVFLFRCHKQYAI